MDHAGFFFRSRFDSRNVMIEWFTETTGKQRLIYGLIGIGVCLILFFGCGLLWFWLWAVSLVLLLSSAIGEWS